MIKKILDTGESLSQIGAWVSGAILLGVSILISVEVILRKVFSISMGGADEISGYAMAASCSWAFAYALFKKAHIRIDILYMKFPQTVKYALDIFSLVLFGIYMTVLSNYALQVFLTSLSRNSTANTPLHTPLWIPQLIWASGLVLFTLAIYLILIGTIIYLWSSKEIEAQQLSGTTSLEDEIEESIIGVETENAEPAGGLK